MTYYERNKEKIIEYSKKWKKDNPKKVKLYRKKYSLNNKEKIKIKNKKYRELNSTKPRRLLTKEERMSRRLERRRKINKSRRLKLRVQVFSRDKYTCKICGRKPPEVALQVDHKYPKSKGGLDKMYNYQTLCTECNIGKTDSILTEFKK